MRNPASDLVQKQSLLGQIVLMQMVRTTGSPLKEYMSDGYLLPFLLPPHLLLMYGISRVETRFAPLVELVCQWRAVETDLLVRFFVNILYYYFVYLLFFVVSIVWILLGLG